MDSPVQVVDYRCSARRGDRPFEEQHARTCIIVVWSGSFTYRLGPTATTMGPGAVMLGNAGASYACSHEHVGGDRCLSVSYDAELIAEVGATVGVRDLAAPFRVPALPPLPWAGAFAHALTAARRGAIAWSLEEVALALAAWVLREQTTPVAADPPARPTRADTQRIVEAMLHLDDHSGDALTLGEIATHAGTSPFHFLRTFRTLLGVTPHQYLVRRRLAQAAAMLLDTHAPITAIAYDVGFGDLAHFIRTFGRAFGCSPRAFRHAGGLPSLTARNAKSPAVASR